MLELSPDEITEGPLVRALVILAAPLLLQNLVRVIQHLVDLFWLGRLGADAVAAVGLAFPIVALLFALTVYAPFVGTQVVVSQRVGGGASGGGQRALTAGLALAGVLGLGVGTVAFLAADPLVDLLTVTRTGDHQVPGLGVAYLQVYALGMVAIAVGDATEAGFVGWGDSRAALHMNVAAVAANVVLDPVLIFGLGPVPHLGVRGAALASVLGALAGIALGGIFLVRGRSGVRLPLAWPAMADVREVVNVGAPATGQQVARQVVRVAIIAVVYAAAGAAGVAAYVVGSRVASTAFVPALGLQQAAQSVVGQNLGAGRVDRARRATWTGVAIATVGLGLVAALQWFVPAPLVELLAPALDPAGAALAVTYLRILAIGYPAIGAAYLLEAGFNGARRTRTSFVATLLQFWVVRLPIAAGGALLLDVGVVAVFWAVTLSNVAVAVGLGLYYRSETSGGMLDRAAGRVTVD